MRSVAVLLLALLSVSLLRAPTDSIRLSHPFRPSPRGFLLLTISREAPPSPVSPSRRDLALESALDEEDSSDRDPPDALARGITSDPLDGRRPEPAATRPPLAASTDHCRSRCLRC